MTKTKKEHIYIEKELILMSSGDSNIELDTAKHSVVISNFEGPLDLLCFLISKNKKDIFEISLSELTDDYIEYLNSMAELDMEIATEFLVMASTLLYIKSKKLLPTLDVPDDVEEMTAEELMHKITMYKVYKEKQDELRLMYSSNFGTFEKLPEKLKFERKFFLPSNVSLNALEVNYSAVCTRNIDKINKKAEEIEKIAVYEKVTVKSKVIIMLDKLKTKSKVVFNKLFNSNSNKKIDIVTAFLGMLELSRLKQVKINQDKLYGDIEIEKISSEEFDVSLLKE